MIQLLAGDCRDVLPTLPANSVQCVVCSPPYYGLRDYGTALWDGGDPACDHKGMPLASSASTLAGYTSDTVKVRTHTMPVGQQCHCGARRIDRQIGLEATPDLYIATMVAVFREVRRVLQPDGTCWVNMGDAYNSQNGFHRGAKYMDGGTPRINEYPDRSGSGLKPKDLLMMPARLALALQADGWWLRSDIIWHKPNPMPESCRDRPTSAHEHVFLLTRSARYYYDAEAVREDAEYGRREWTNGRKSWDTLGNEHSGITGTTKGAETSAGRSCRNVWTIATAPFSDWGETSRQVRVAWDAPGDGKKRKASSDCPVHGDQAVCVPNEHDDGHADGLSSHTGRNGGHHVQAQAIGSEPTDLPPEPVNAEQSSDLPLLACLPVAMPRSSQSHRTDLDLATSQPCSASAGRIGHIGGTLGQPEHSGSAGRMLVSNTSQGGSDGHPSAQTDDHSADTSSSDLSRCTCEWYIEKTEKTSHFATYPPALAERCIKAGSRTGDTVLDPFAGAGTSLLVADRLQRHAIGIELNTAYTEMAMERCRADAPLFADMNPPPAADPEDERMADLFAEAAE